MSAADTAIRYALAQVGKPYKWGTAGPNTFDCSGLVMASYAAAGVKLPRTTYTQVLLGTRVSSSKLLMPGDLVFPDPGHVQIYLGNGKVVEAPHTGANVRIMNMWGFWTARRVSAPGASISYQPADNAPGKANNPCYDVITTGQGPVFVWNGSCPDSEKGKGPESAPSLPGEDQLGSILSAITSMSAAFQYIGSRLVWITQPANWLRIGEFAAGMVLLIIGLLGLSHVTNALKKTAATAGKVANA